MSNNRITTNNSFSQFFMNKPILMEDETNISYMLRVGAANGGHYKDVNGLFNYLGFTVESGAFFPERLHYPINKFLKTIEAKESPLQFYLKSTEMKFVNLIERPVSLDYFWVVHYQGLSNFKSIYKKNSLFNLCEHCMKEDQENGRFPIIHLSHQLPGVKVCPIHNVKLNKYYLVDRKHFPFGFERYDEVNQSEVSDSDYRYAIFMYELSKTKMDYTLDELIQDMNQKMDNNYAIHFLEELSDEHLVCLYNKYSCKGDFTFEGNNALDLFRLMYFIYRDPINIHILPKNEHFEAFREKIDGKYELIGDYRESLVELKCLNCGETFITTHRLILNHHECPHCKALGCGYYGNLVKHYVDNEYQGKYELVSYDHDKRRVTVYNLFMKKTRNLNVYELLTKHVNSLKPAVQSNDVIWNRYSCYGTYGQCYKGEFLIRDVSETYFLHEMFDLVGDEYQLVGEYKNMFSEVELRHSLCGKVVRVKPYDFLNGKRCENCKVKHRAETIEDFLNAMIPEFYFMSNFDSSIDSYLFRAIQYKYSYRMACVERIYQFTEDMLIQEILRVDKKNQLFRTAKLNWDIFYEFFFQKDISSVSKEFGGGYYETHVP